MRATLLLGDSAARLRDLADASVDAVVTDPPAGIGFMSKEWDSDRGGRDLPSGFGPWLAGLCDGEANFDIHRQRRPSGDYYYCRFELGLRADDGGMLAMLQNMLGGKLYQRERNAPSDTAGSNPTVRWELVAREECLRLVDIFDRFPLQSKKSRDYAIWREALAVSCSNAGTNRPDLMAPFWEQLRGTRPYGGVVTEASAFREMQHDHRWIAWMTGVMRECLRVLRPGGYALVWALPRTSHWTATAIEDAGFEIRDVHHHIFGTGFPKSLDVAKAFDAAGGVSPADQAALLRAKREGTGLTRQQLAEMVGCTESSIRNWEEGRARRAGGAIEHMVPSKAYRSKLAEILGYTDDERLVIGVAADRRRDGSVYGVGHSGTLRAAGSTSAARRWKGHGTALKPAVEHWILARKPLEGTYAENVLAHGTGALNIDACRIGAAGGLTRGVRCVGASALPMNAASGTAEARERSEEHALGRWPAHLSLEHADGCRLVGERLEERAVLESDPIPAYETRGHTLRDGLGGSRRVGTVPVKHEVWQCVEGCPVRTLDEQSGERTSGSRKAGVRKGIGYDSSAQGDGGPALAASTGGASRFFYIAKPARSEKDRGLEDLPAVDGGAATGRTEGSAGLKSPRAGSGRNGGGRNTHPTVKAVALMRWLVRLITPPGGLVLDPFAGSGTTGVACAEEGLRFLGVEQDPKFHETARLRLKRSHGACATELPAQRDMAAVLIAQPRAEDEDNRAAARSGEESR